MIQKTLRRCSTWPLVMTVMMASLAACREGQMSTPADAPEPVSSQASISASPNPVPAGSGKTSTTITWDTGDGSIGQVFVSVNGGSEKPLAGNRARGSHEAKFIQNGSYEFRLYRKKKPGEVVASVKVRRLPK